LALADQIPPFSVKIAGTELSWEAGRSTFEVVARDVRAIEPGGLTVLALPRVAMTFSLRALMNGILAPVRLRIDAPDLHVERRPDGSFTFDLGPDSGAPAVLSASRLKGDADAGGTADLVLDDLLQVPDPHHSMGYLTQVEVRAGRLTVDDRQRDTIWHATEMNLAVERGAGGMVIDAALDLDLGGTVTRLAGRADYDRHNRHIDGHIDLAGGTLSPAGITAVQGARLADFRRDHPGLGPATRPARSACGRFAERPRTDRRAASGERRSSDSGGAPRRELQCRHGTIVDR
jgi:hypothetical protein